MCDVETRCWLWTRSTNGAEYGKFDGEYVHRLSWVEAHGGIPDGLWVLHRCDTPRCLNPTHLFLGTVADNQRDMAQKGRSTIGDRNPSRLYPSKVKRGEAKWNSVLTETTVRQIRDQYTRGGVTIATIAQQIGVSPNAVACAIGRRTWAHVA